MSEALAQVEILLSANTARFQESWENATQTVNDSTSTIRDRVLAMGQSISAAALAGVAALGAITMQQVELASNVSKSASLAVVSAETFQYWAAGAKTVGVEQEKLGDILKDTNDKIGDFLANEGGEMQDFFNNIAPKVGVTAEQFRGLSGAEGLQLYYDTLVKANTGSAEMVFYMESIADEASALIPLLANGGEKLKYWGELAQSTGYIMSDSLIAKAKELGEQTEIMAMRWQGFKNSISEITLPPLANWLTELNKTGGAFETVSKSVVSGLQSITDWLNNGGMHQVAGVVGAVAVSAMVNFGASVASTIPSIRASTASLLENARASVANATSMARLGDILMTVAVGHHPVQIAIYRYSIATKEAIANTIAFTRALPAKITQLHRSTTAMLANARASLTMANAQKLATTTAVLMGRGVVGVGTALSRVGGVIKAHPLILLATVMSAIVVKTEGLKGAMESLGQTVGVVGVMFEDFVSTAVDGWGMIFDVAGDVLGGILGQSQETTGSVTGYFGEMFKGTEGGFVGLLQVGAKIFDNLATHAITFSKMTVQNVTNAWIHIKNGFKQAGNGIVAVFEGVANKGVDFANSIIDKINAIIRGLNTISGFTGITLNEIQHVGYVSLGRLAIEDVPINNNYQAQYEQNKVTVATDYIDQTIKFSKEQVRANNEVAKSLNNIGQAYKGVQNRAEEADKQASQASDAQKEAAQRAWENLVNTYYGQMAAWDKMALELKMPFMTELSTISWEIENQFGKFFSAPKRMKQELKNVAKQVDEIKLFRNLKDLGNDFTKKIDMVGKETEFDALIFDLHDVNNILSTLTNETLVDYQDRITRVITKVGAKDLLQRLAADFELEKITHELNQQNIATKNQLELLVTAGDLNRELLTIDQEKSILMSKYQGLLKNNQESFYRQIEERVNQSNELQKQLKIQTAYQNLIDGIISDEEKKLSVMREQLDIVAKQYELYQKFPPTTAVPMDTTKARVTLLNNSLGISEVEQSPIDKIHAEYERRQELINVYLVDNLALYAHNEAEKTKILSEAKTAREKIEADHFKKLAEMQKATSLEYLADTESIFGSIAKIIKDTGGEQTRSFAAAFAIQKSFAIAQSMMNAYTAVSEALKTPFPANLGLMAQAMAEGMSIVANIRAIKNPIGQAHDGIMSVPKSGTWNLEKGERVLPKHTAQNLDRTLANLQDKRQSETKIIINNYTGEKTDVQQMPNGDFMVTIGKMMQQVARHEVAEHHRRSKRQGWDR